MFRACDAQLGRWLSADSLAEAGGSNLYVYCYSNLLKFYDPDGLMVARPESMLTNSEIADALSDGLLTSIDGVIPFMISDQVMHLNN